MLCAVIVITIDKQQRVVRRHEPKSFRVFVLLNLRHGSFFAPSIYDAVGGVLTCLK
jgi:hypothetical protein